MDRLTDSKERSNTATMGESSHSGIMCVYQLYPHQINKRRKNPKCSVGWREILERETHTSLEDRLQIWKSAWRSLSTEKRKAPRKRLS